ELAIVGVADESQSSSLHLLVKRRKVHICKQWAQWVSLADPSYGFLQFVPILYPCLEEYKDVSVNSGPLQYK
ncbi:MAG: hypothetical protein PWP25_1830, partial [Sphaerochaeta sp.]|nr:hypothetical protein [Sphaerochaeta sp.]